MFYVTPMPLDTCSADSDGEAPLPPALFRHVAVFPQLGFAYRGSYLSRLLVECSANVPPRVPQGTSVFENCM